MKPQTRRKSPVHTWTAHPDPAKNEQGYRVCEGCGRKRIPMPESKHAYYRYEGGNIGCLSKPTMPTPETIVNNLIKPRRSPNKICKKGWRLSKELTDYCNHLAKENGIEYDELNIYTTTRMKRTLGTHYHRRATGEHAIVFNLGMLQHAPKDTVKEVILHELAHIVHPNHGREFKILCNKLGTCGRTHMPSWRKSEKSETATTKTPTKTPSKPL